MYYLAIVFISGLSMTLSFAPLSILIIQYISLAVLVCFFSKIVFTNSVNKKTLPAFICGLVFGLGWFLGVISWVYITMHRFGGLSVLFAGFATFVFCFYLALFPALALAGTAYIQQKTIPKNHTNFESTLLFSITFANIFTLAEILRSYLFSGLGWMSFGYAHTNSSILSLKNLAPIIGERGITWLIIFIVALITLSITNCFRQKKNHLLIAPSLIFTVVLLTANFANFNFTYPTNNKLNFLIVQGNLPISMKWDPSQYKKNLASYQRLINEHNSADKNNLVVVLPETALTLFTEPTSISFINKLINKNINFIAGGIEDESIQTTKYYNSALIVNNGKTQFYRKIHLVPFGEFTPPLFEWFGKKFNIPMANLSAGNDKQKNLVINNTPISLSICYENLFSQENRERTNKAGILINISNTGWYGDSWAMPQHLQISQMRAIEAQKPMIHSADTGISANITAQGEIVNFIPINQQGTIETRVESYKGSTPFVQYGEWIIWLAMALLQTLILIWVKIRRKYIFMESL